MSVQRPLAYITVRLEFPPGHECGAKEAIDLTMMDAARSIDGLKDAMADRIRRMFREALDRLTAGTIDTPLWAQEKGQSGGHD